MSKQYKCKTCGGRRWVVIKPMNYVGSCPECAPLKSIFRVQEERKIELYQDENDQWQERLIQ